MRLTNLKNTIKNYLKDAGFSESDFLLDDKGLTFIEVFFLSASAIDYIIEDIQKTDYRNIIEIKRYKYGNGNVTAIINFKD